MQLSNTIGQNTKERGTTLAEQLSLRMIYSLAKNIKSEELKVELEELCWIEAASIIDRGICKYRYKFG